MVLFGEKPTDDTNVELNKQCALLIYVQTPAAKKIEATVWLSRVGSKVFESTQLVEEADMESGIYPSPKRACGCLRRLNYRLKLHTALLTGRYCPTTCGCW